MLFSPIDYDPPVYRPPSEANSLLVQLTIGCSHNKCTYCAMYRTKTYRVRLLDEVFAELEQAQKFYLELGVAPRKVFLCDGDALGAPMPDLVAVLDKINELFPTLQRIGVYATAYNILEKSPEDLRELVKRKLSLAYLGMESGADEVLHLIVKGNTAADMLAAARKMRECRWKLSVIIMLGVGGRKLSPVHTGQTAKIISQIAPEFFSFLTTVPVPGTPYHTMVERKLIDPLTTRELLEEMRDILGNIATNGEKIIFRANHVSNLFPLEGILPRDKEKLTSVLEHWIAECPAGTYPQMDPCRL